MATDPKEPKEVLPALDDDVDVGAENADEGRSEDNADRQDGTAPRAEDEKPESPREAAVRRYRELRDSKARPVEDESSDDAADAADDDDPEPVQAQAEQKRQPVPVAAQQSSHANDTALDATRALLEQTKALLEEAKAARAAPAAANDDADDETDPAQAADAKRGLDADKLEDIVERIQIGDKAEGRQALSELIEIMGAGNKPDDVGRVVQQQIAQNQVLGEIAQATSTFRQKYKGLVDDSDLLESSLRRLNGEIRDDLVKSGAKAEDIDRASPDQLMTMHQQARLKGQKVRGYGEIFEKVGADVSAKFAPMIGGGQRTPPAQPQTQQSSTINDRLERKRVASAQPRAAGVRSTQEPQKKPKTREEVVMEMRRQRGFKS